MLDESETLEEQNVEQIQRLHLLTISHLDEDQPERDQFEKVFLFKNRSPKISIFKFYNILQRILQRSIDLSKEKFGCPNIRQGTVHSLKVLLKIFGKSSSSKRGK